MTEVAPIGIVLTLGAHGFIATLPSGRTLNVSATEAGARFLAQMLRDAEAARAERQRLLATDFPTQEIARIWERNEAKRIALQQQLREHAAEKEEARKRSAAAKAKQKARVWKKRGIDVSKVKVSI